MKYIGLNSQIWRNNFKSVILLILFPVVILGLVWLFVFLVQPLNEYRIERANQLFLTSLPWVLAGVGVWFVIAWFSHTGMIERATGSRPLSRKENKRIYNLVENLCIAGGMPMPKVNIIDDDSLNAFASGINTSTFTVSLSRGIIDKLDDAELEAVIAHELTHIRNRDVRLLIVSIIFVGIFAFLTEALVRSVRFSGGSNKKDGRVVIVALLLAAIGYFLSSIFRFAISRQREYMADAGSAMMTKNPLALASALEKISVDSQIEAVKRNDVAQMFIDNPRDKKVRPVSFS
ncbi:MAG TPA: M48 family metallopeptidase, partial [Bacteroidales bacterium]|nr:M48 family metallopeptidase [Bacteroidales bacterium]HPV27622.1 M48 family metallopeptidase [Bacteroidales bacterium]HQI12808.1 M48 family metallopeptidase [Bacteroidales bacterium]HQL46810.1 M48 family metallopeptidase [Bacteroidales bacterium]